MSDEGRTLVCNRCTEFVLVHEEPHQYIDPHRYVCGRCLMELAENDGETQLKLDTPPPEEREETRPYDPDYSEIPY